MGKPLNNSMASAVYCPHVHKYWTDTCTHIMCMHAHMRAHAHKKALHMSNQRRIIQCTQNAKPTPNVHPASAQVNVDSSRACTTVDLTGVDSSQWYWVKFKPQALTGGTNVWFNFVGVWLGGLAV